MKPKFNIGDAVWYVWAAQMGRKITCPDCLGSGALRVIMGDGTCVRIDCTNCKPSGYEAPTGKEVVYDFQAKVQQVTISGVEIRNNAEVEYKTEIAWPKESSIFATKEEAEARGVELVIEHVKEELKRREQKEKPTRDWGWNATYHRSAIRRAEKELEYHRAKLAIAEIKKVKVEVER